MIIYMNKKYVILVKNCHDISLAQLLRPRTNAEEKKRCPKKYIRFGFSIPNFLSFLVHFDIEMAKIYLEYPSRAIFKKKKLIRRKAILGALVLGKTILFSETQNMTSS